MPNPAAPPALRVRGLQKSFGTTRALDGFDLTVPAGTVHALLGPNGAGKSTAVACLTTLSRHDAGTVEVAGADVRTDGVEVRRRIGLVGQESALDEVLHGRENLVLFARLHGLSKAAAQQRSEELLDAFGLTEAADRKVSTYSGGMRRRLDIAVGLVRTPAVLFLDEPTTGLDPRARNEVWALVRQVVAQGTTVLLTTQYLDEADQLSDRVTVMDRGRVVAEGTSTELKARLGGDRVVVTLRASTLGEEVAALQEKLTVVGLLVDVQAVQRQLLVEAGPEGGTSALRAVVRALDDTGTEVEDVLLRRPTLDEVFLHLTGGSR